MATCVLGVALGLAALFGAILSMYMPMATDNCGLRDCRPGLMTVAQLLGFGSIAVGLLGAPVGVFIAASKRKRMFVWPLAGVVLIVVGVATGMMLADVAGG
ncbi:hypothetical protein MBRU_18280 [Mycolicibacterium brumae DSM 44177]|nr:hypothetical protein MBRU_18280 [Mycolicibacterium brumae DSM 44177]